MEKQKKAIIGYRAWGLVRREGVWLLQSVAVGQHGQTWLSPAVSAHERPRLSDSSGIHAFKQPEFVEFDYEGLPVYGSIQLYGRVVEHKFGYRAEKAVMQELQLNVSMKRFLGETLIGFAATVEQMQVAQVRGRLRGEVKLVTRFKLCQHDWIMKDVQDAKKALETRYQVDVTINLEEIN